MNELFLALVLSWTVMDGDTIRVTARVWPNIVVEERIRLLEVDTPEKDGRKRCERELAAKATEWTRARMSATKKPIMISSPGHRDSFGRILGYVYVDNVSINAEMIKAGVARPYSDVVPKPRWC